MKVVIDTNIWISYLLGSLLQGMDGKILSKEIKVVVSDELLKEISEVSSRPKFKNVFTAKRIKELFSLLDSYAIVVSPSQKVNVCRDGKDNFLLHDLCLTVFRFSRGGMWSYEPNQPNGRSLLKVI